ncbi:terminase large subunit domain-containing protein [Comamonas aquatica]|uniref:terminase large subunit domain-containing protein n=1 Tax=Comamonas aquatica TaxID=225991 RepID=UPI001B36D5E4|nr:terminase family protein [Comamonas aquatica]QTX19887.1 terminase family protein [Comamonas aquatica]
MQETINTQQAREGESPDFAALLTAQAHVDGAARQVAELADGSQPRTVARHMYWTGWRIKLIAEHLGLPASTVYGWCKAEKWDEAKPLERVNGTLELRLVQLIMRESKTGGDFKEIDLLGRQLERTARIERYQDTGKEGDLNPKIAHRNAAPKRKPKRNEFTQEQIDQLVEIFHAGNFVYQNRWFEAQQERIRILLKARQLGATWYFAREALIRAITEGRNQIFLSASKAQAHQFKNYMIAFAREVDVDLSGDPIMLWNNAELHFLGTNAATAQGRSGDFYFDEFFWAGNFKELNKVASAMATHKHWRRTYFSTPSAKSHQAYPFWLGQDRNKGRAKSNQVQIDVSHRTLASGMRCADGRFRQIVTMDDAVRQGFHLVDIEELQDEYPPDEYANLFDCEFIDDSNSIFTLALMQPCMVDSWEVWADDFKPLATRPFARKPVWVGYDPSYTGDTAALVVLAPPAVPGGKFRLLHRQQFRGADFDAQAEYIRSITQQYNVTFMGIDTTGMGQGVYQQVIKFYPQARAYHYDLALKSRLVLKAQQVITKGRLEMDHDCTDVAASFMAIKKVLTPSQRHVTYHSGRSDDIGHADLAWAVMHALDNENLAGDVLGGNSSVEIYE